MTRTLRLVAPLVALVALAPLVAALPLVDVRQGEVYYSVPGLQGHLGDSTLAVAESRDASPARSSSTSSASSSSSDGATVPDPLPIIVADFPVGTVIDSTLGTVAQTTRLARSSTPTAQDPTAPASASAPVWYVGHSAEPGAGSAGASPMAAGATLAAVAAVSAAGPATASVLGDRLRRFAPIAFLYTRIAKERLLDHGGRERLLAAVRSSPGIVLADAARVAGIPRNTAVYHLTRLEREGLVSSMREGRTRLYFAPGGLDQRANAEALVALRNPTTNDIARTVGAQPGLDQQALCARFGIAPSLAHWHATRLVDAGVVTAQRDGRRVRYYPGAAYAVVSARGAWIDASARYRGV